MILQFSNQCDKIIPKNLSLKMNLEESAKQDLFDFQICQTMQFYDPYRRQNLKHSPHPFNSYENFMHSFDKNQTPSPRNKIVLKNDRKTLKLMLQRLDSIQSPSKQCKNDNEKDDELHPRTISYSSTQPLKPTKNNSVSFKQNSGEYYKNYESQKLASSSTSYQKMKKTDNFTIKMQTGYKFSIGSKEERVRSLIKEKLAVRGKEKEKEKVKRKITTAYGQRNGKYKMEMNKKYSHQWGKTNPKTLLNLLC